MYLAYYREVAKILYDSELTDITQVSARYKAILPRPS
jgi:hypothetical protein